MAFATILPRLGRSGRFPKTVKLFFSRNLAARGRIRPRLAASDRLQLVITASPRKTGVYWPMTTHRIYSTTPAFTPNPNPNLPPPPIAGLLIAVRQTMFGAPNKPDKSGQKPDNQRYVVALKALTTEQRAAYAIRFPLFGWRLILTSPSTKASFLS
jgi:hypothetical protein